MTLRLLHLSDTHLTGDGSLHHGLVDTTAALDRVLQRAVTAGPLDAVVLAGDLSDDGSPASYAALRSRVDRFAADHGAVVVAVPGNHDDRAAFELALGPRCAVHDVRGHRIVALDTSVPGAGYGHVPPGLLTWLAEALAPPAPGGAVVVLHHPPVPAASTLLRALELVEPEPLLDVLEAAGVRLVLAGHYHHGMVQQVRGIPVVVSPGVANHSDPLAAVGTERAVAGAGMDLVDLSDDGAVRVTFLESPGPDDGAEVFALDAAAVRSIAEAAGPTGPAAAVVS